MGRAAPAQMGIHISCQASLTLGVVEGKKQTGAAARQQESAIPLQHGMLSHQHLTLNGSLGASPNKESS